MTSRATELYIIGAGGHGKVVADAAACSGRYHTITFWDDSETGSVIGIPVAGTVSAIPPSSRDTAQLFVAIGDCRARMAYIAQMRALGFAIATIIHPNAVLSPHASIGAGTVVMAGVVVQAGAAVGEGCILNTGCTVDHDCVLEDGVHISPGAHLGGNVHVGANTWVCVGASVAHGIRIGKDTTIAAGAAVVRDIGDGVLAAGVPAVIKQKQGILQ